MVESSKGSRGPENGLEAEAALAQGDKQATLLKLAERTVLQAEALAQEITEHAKNESEAEGVKIVAQYTDQAKAEAQQIIESAQSRSEAILHQAATDARTGSEKVLTKAQSDSEKMLSKARSEIEEDLDKTQTEGQEILGKARQEAQAIIKASQARADSTESDARMKAEFVIRQTTQNVAEGIRSTILEICNNLLPAVEESGYEAPEALIANHADGAVAIDMQMLENGASHETKESASPPEPVHTNNHTQSSDRSSVRKVKSSGKKKKMVASGVRRQVP